MHLQVNPGKHHCIVAEYIVQSPMTIIGTKLKVMQRHIFQYLNSSMLNLTDYHRLNDCERKFIFDTHAVQVASRATNHFQFTLYQVFGFYIERINELKSGMLASFHCFDNTSHLDFYLEEIKTPV